MEIALHDPGTARFRRPPLGKAVAESGASQDRARLFRIVPGPHDLLIEVMNGDDQSFLVKDPLRLQIIDCFRRELDAEGSAMRPRSRSRQLLDHDVREVGQLIVVGQKHVTAELDRRREMEGVCQPVPLWLSGWNCRVCMSTPDRAVRGVHRGSQAQRPQVRPVEESKKSLTVTDFGVWDFGSRPGMRRPRDFATNSHDNDVD